MLFLQVNKKTHKEVIEERKKVQRKLLKKKRGNVTPPIFTYLEDTKIKENNLKKTYKVLITTLNS